MKVKRQTITDPAAEKKAEPPRITLVYLGARLDTDGEILHDYRSVWKGIWEGGAEEKWQFAEDTERRSFGKKLAGVTPGGIFSICVTPGKEDSSVQIGTDRWVGFWPSEFDRVKWTASSRAVENAVTEAKALEKVLTENAAITRLEPFKEAYRKLGVGPRRQMLAEVLRYITGGV